jgi:hypothetical protein
MNEEGAGQLRSSARVARAIVVAGRWQISIGYRDFRGSSWFPGSQYVPARGRRAARRRGAAAGFQPETSCSRSTGARSASLTYNKSSHQRWRTPRFEVERGGTRHAQAVPILGIEGSLRQRAPNRVLGITRSPSPETRIFSQWAATASSSRCGTWFVVSAPCLYRRRLRSQAADRSGADSDRLGLARWRRRACRRCSV